MRQWLRFFFNPVVLFGLAFLVALHQYVNWGVWFELKDIHHEVFIVALLFAAIVSVFWRGR